MKEAILVTGASGLVGSWLVNRLLECHPDAEIFLLLRATSRREASNRVSVLHSARTSAPAATGSD